jgi:hypothetical protein
MKTLSMLCLLLALSACAARNPDHPAAPSSMVIETRGEYEVSGQIRK